MYRQVDCISFDKKRQKQLYISILHFLRNKSQIFPFQYIGKCLTKRIFQLKSHLLHSNRDLRDLHNNFIVKQSTMSCDNTIENCIILV